MSSLPKKAKGGGKGKAALPKLFPLPEIGGLGWDIAEYVMYCHLCGALSELSNTLLSL